MKVSIITITYNSEKTLRDTMESVLIQSYPDIEYIIKDGGSKDGTMDIVHEFEPKFSGRLKYVSAPDAGIYDAMNKGIELATGDIIGIINSDDYLALPNSIDKIVEGFLSHDADAVYGYTKCISQDNPNVILEASNSKYFKPWMMRGGYQLSHPSFYCKKDLYAKYGLFKTKYRIAADFDLLVRLILINKIKLHYIPAEIATFRMGGASSNGMNSFKTMYFEQRQILKENGVKTNAFLFMLRYAFKVFINAYTRFKYNILKLEYK